MNLLSEQNLDIVGVFLFDQREDRCVDSVEHLGTERADIVKVELECMKCRSVGGREFLAGKFGS